VVLVRIFFSYRHRICSHGKAGTTPELAGLASLAKAFRSCQQRVESVCFDAMSKGKFTTEAALLWGGIPVEIQKRILKNAFCAKCHVVVELVDYTGTVENGDLVLDGSCAVCGHAAARVVETSQASHENN